MPVENRENRDYYWVLDVDPIADSKAIGAAYQWRLQGLGPDALQQRQEIDEAFEVLSNPAKRALYDYVRATRHSAHAVQEAAARRRAEQERARQRSERLEQRMRAWRQRTDGVQPLG
jgi:DnaJ-class molecular chaperone